MSLLPGLVFLAHDDQGVPLLTDEQRRMLLGVARDAIAVSLSEGRPPGEYARGTLEPAPLFVTLWDALGGLRGCVGHIEARCRTFEDEVTQCAVGAAFGDPRFPELGQDELEGLGLDITLLGRLQPVEDARSLDPHRWGVLVRGPMGRRGVLLPNVEGVDTAEDQVSIATRKGGISRRDPVELFRYAVCKFGSHAAG